MQAKAGDRHAIEALYRQLAPLVLGYLRGQGAREPEDLASDVFVQMIRGLPRFQGDTVALRSWVLVIAHRRAIDERRRLGRRRRIAEVVPLTEDAAGSGDVEREVLGRLERERVLEAIDELTDDQRSVVLLHSVGGLALSQVARLVGKHPGAVKSLHRRGLAAVARHLRRSEEVPHRRAAGEA